METPKSTTGNAAVSKSEYLIRLANGIVKVDGAENFEVYSVTGQKQNTKTSLKSGVYIVKINDYTQKVIVK